MKTSTVSEPRNGEWHARYFLLRSAYEAAFHHLAAEARALRDIVSGQNADAATIAGARARIEHATTMYRTTRDSLSEFLLGRSAQV